MAALKPELEIVAAAKVSNSVSDVPIYAVYHSPVGSTTICSKGGYILYGSFDPNWSNVRGSKGIVFPLDDKPDWIKKWEKTVRVYKSC